MLFIAQLQVRKQKDVAKEAGSSTMPTQDFAAAAVAIHPLAVADADHQQESIIFLGKAPFPSPGPHQRLLRPLTTENLSSSLLLAFSDRPLSPFPSLPMLRVVAAHAIVPIAAEHRSVPFADVLQRWREHCVRLS